MKRRNPLQRLVRDGTFSPKRERDRTKYKRKPKHPRRNYAAD
jgi:hypothetical protein